MLKCTQKRSEFVKRVLDDPKKGAKELKEIALGLENCKNTYDVIYALSEMLYLSERTITRDYKRQHDINKR
jgi:hypothetical protein